ncbi:hypothetical protein ASPWEDRAFT_391402 [Aspergillus wentii DTO 134E9]|uniref:Uncharacterized protein n=1 Tax=Aspergillus wentii DTO 134E9 TaxID=1073089 RepID=A0A1L9RXZ8_ASPWE|nr:uncharacterized protein ASPWEDRAFT_391402 [Aspergillus wentii DTO 134E9]OJJ39763.1 hypothetical protein ASPWEDRAFT_391402 [Aspergillus wentii DTO 134E9]
MQPFSGLFFFPLPSSHNNIPQLLKIERIFLPNHSPALLCRRLTPLATLHLVDLSATNSRYPRLSVFSLASLDLAAPTLPLPFPPSFLSLFFCSSSASSHLHSQGRFDGLHHLQLRSSARCISTSIPSLILSPSTPVPCLPSLFPSLNHSSSMETDSSVASWTAGIQTLCPVSAFTPFYLPISTD